MEQDPGSGLGDDASEESFDLDRLLEMLGFVINALRRHTRLAALAFVAVAAVGLLAATALPRMYNSQVKLLATRRSMARSPIPGMDSVDDSTKNVSAMIVRRSNLDALAQQVNLVERFYKTRSPILKLKDRLLAKIRGPVSAADQQLALVQTLEKRLEVTMDDSTSTVTIAVDWPNAQLAYDLVTNVTKNFLEARYDSDVAMITDSIGVLDEHAKDALDHVDTELDAYQKVVERLAKTEEAARTPAHAATPQAAGSFPSPLAPIYYRPDPEKAKALEEIRARIRSLEETQQRTLDNLKQQLMQAQLTLTPMHPTVIALQQQVDAMSVPPPDLVALRSQERALMDQLAAPAIPAVSPRRSVQPPEVASEAPAAAPSAAASSAPALPLVLDERDGQLQLAQSRLASAIRAYEDAVGRIDSAKIELDETLAEYKHKYTLVTPAEVPKRPKKATPQLVAVGAVLGAAFLSILLAVAAEIIKGVILQPWQVRRSLKLEVLGELDNPS